MLAEKKAVMCSIDNMFCFMNIATALASFERGDEGQEVIDIQKRLVELHIKYLMLTVNLVLKQKLL